MNDTAEAAMLDLVYGAAYEPDLWVRVMERVADRIGGDGGVLTQFSMVDGSGAMVLSRLDPAILPVYFERFSLDNPLSNVDDAYAYLKDWQPRIVTDEDWMPKEKLVSTVYYNEFLVPQDIHSTVMIRLAAEGVNVSAISLTRSHRKPQFGAEDLRYVQWLHPHLIRSFNLGRSFAAARQFTSNLADALGHSEHAVFLLGDDGRIRFANGAAEALTGLGAGLRIVSGHLTTADGDAARALAALVVAATSADPALRRGGSLAVPTRDRRLPLSLTVAPVPVERVSVFDARPAAIICVTDLEAGISPPEQKLRALFGLTGAETRVALALFEGASPQEAAGQLGLSVNTVRVHLAKVFDKTGVNRQSELVRLMMRTVGMGV